MSTRTMQVWGLKRHDGLLVAGATAFVLYPERQYAEESRYPGDTVVPMTLKWEDSQGAPDATD